MKNNAELAMDLELRRTPDYEGRLLRRPNGPLTKRRKGGGIREIMGTYFLIRHGETDANQKGILQGHLDIPLDERGKKEAQLAGKALSKVKLDVVYTSDLSRAKETAEAIIKQQGDKCRLMLDRRLREIHCGRLQGMTMADWREKFPEFYKMLREDPIHTRRPGGESYEDLFDRSVRALEDIYANYPEGNVAVVSHGGVVRCLLAYASGQEVNPSSFTPANGSISIISRNGDGWKVVSANNIDHLSSVLDNGTLERGDELYRW